MTKNIVYHFLIAALLSSCFMRDNKTELIPSPSNKYFVKAIVNRTDKQKPDYADIILHVYDRQKKLFDFDSQASDAQKWALGWTTKGDTIILQTSDIGDRAWVIDPTGPTEIEMTDALRLRAAELKAEKYE